MISFKVNVEDKKNVDAVKEGFHNALVGSPAYINSEIAICDGGEECDFFLVVGNNNDNDLAVDLNINGKA